MKKSTALTAAFLAALWIPASGHSLESPLQRAALAWDRGDYPAALTAYLQVLDSPAADSALETIALQTGELYPTTELTANGAAPQFSPDGSRLVYETGPVLKRLTRLLPSDLASPATEWTGSAAAFSPDGRKLVYLKLAATPELTDAQAALERAGPEERALRQAAFTQLTALRSTLVVRDLASGAENTIDTADLRKTAPAFGRDGTILFAGGPAGAEPVQIYTVAEGRAAAPLTTGAGDKAIIDINSTGTTLLYSARAGGAGPGRGGRGGRSGPGGGAAATFGVLSLADGRAATITGSAPSFSRDGGMLTYVVRDGAESRLMLADVANPSKGVILHKGPARLDAPAISPDGARVAFQMMPNLDWEIYVVDREGDAVTRVTREIQHDIVPRFLTPNQLLGAIGEPRHRRSYLYNLPSMKRTRLFHNNTVRTIAPEYDWVPSPDGTKVLIVSERDGDTVSPERGVYLVDLARRVTRDEVRARVKASLEAEQALVTRGKHMYAPIAAEVRSVVAGASVERVYGYEKTLFDFDSKHVSQPGNKLAAAYLFDRYTSFGYEPEYQPFEYRGRGGAAGGQTANVVATLKGTVNPELIYVVSSHYDSVAGGPGADDDSSGTAALLETARILAGHPQPATIVFASFTGEEAGLLGSREFVRRAVAGKLDIVGALNNDMIGWSNDYRLDNTIRYSNRGIRDVQHAAAMQFTNLITYDTLYYKSTDAAAYYEAYGDIVGGIGSYPVLGNPHYHQSHDFLEGINHQLVTEVAKTTAASLMLLASSPARVKNVTVDGFSHGTVKLSWAPSPEKGVTGYIVAFGPPTKPETGRVRVLKPAATLTGIAPGTIIAVKAVDARGLEGWDWASLTVTTPNSQRPTPNSKPQTPNSKPHAQTPRLRAPNSELEIDEIQ